MSLSACISIQFPGNAAEAFTFYQTVFGGDLQIFRYQDFPPMEMPVTPPDEAVAHADLTAEGLHIVGGDAVGDVPDLTAGPYSIMIVPETVDEGRALIRKLEVGGEAVLPFELAPWGDHYGQVRDQFGLLWEINVGAPQGE